MIFDVKILKKLFHVIREISRRSAYFDLQLFASLSSSNIMFAQPYFTLASNNRSLTNRSFLTTETHKAAGACDNPIFVNQRSRTKMIAGIQRGYIWFT